MGGTDYSTALAYLQKVDGAQGTSLYEHLTSVILKLLEEKPRGPVNLLEASLLSKRTAFDTKESSPLVPVSAAPSGAETVQKVLLFGNPERPVNPETGEPLEPQTANEYESDDTVYNGVLFDSLGIGLGRAETYNIMLSVKTIGEDPERRIKQIRFFGKFLGLFSDYYVYEALLKDPPKEDFPIEEGKAPVEINSGANTYVYLVSNHPGGSVVQLPSVLPEQIKAARKIKKFFTGRLTSAVSTYPAFPGNEANYLRAQIARISSTTILAPNNYYLVNDDGLLEKSEDFEGFPGRDLALPSNWVHQIQHMKVQGRCELYKREPPEDDEGEFELTEEEQEEGPELLGTVEEDAPVNSNPAWTSLYSSTNENVKNQVGGLRSNLWPGAYCAGKGTRFANVYVGWGIKNSPFVPLPPPPVTKEFDATLVETQELPLKPAPPPPEEEEEAE